MCRLCLGGEGDSPLVQPCACRGSAQWIHEHCLEQWRRTGPREDAAYRCGQCMDRYRDALSLELLSARLQAERMSGQGTVFTLNTLAGELKVQGKYAEAEPLYREALERQRGTLGNQHQNTLKAKGDLAAAEQLRREALEAQRETLGNRHPRTIVSMNNLGLLLMTKGDLAAAELLFREALEAQRGTLGNNHPDTHTAISNLGLMLDTKGDLAAAELLFREAVKGMRDTLGNRHPSTRSSIKSLNRLLKAKQDKLRPAEKSCGTARRWICGVTRSAVGARARFAPRGASVAPLRRSAVHEGHRMNLAAAELLRRVPVC